MRDMLQRVWRRFRSWWVELPMRLWARSLTAQELREQHQTLVIFGVDAGSHVPGGMRRLYRVVDAEMTRRGLDP